ncbi:hypothetical protein GCM10009693_24300 [Leucobacter chromiireducens subsp. chromiireducens]|uniref:Uncharacterized protein n=1 Tax=Leucobacter chromiireducens subsp. chromiireducens TaxID=660067 RepID=A0ABS1SVP5_9MICO|nr:hypothetical protein [Leucobacter chromiireducens subsp. chromiireducens]
MLVLGLSVYARIDLGIYAELPEAVRALIGIPAHAAPAVLAYSEMLASLGHSHSSASRSRWALTPSLARNRTARSR